MASGIGTSAAIAVGYSPKPATVQASRLLTKANIQLAIADRVHADTSIATRKERQAFWTATLRDPTRPGMERLKASELLGRSHADFIDTHEITGKHGGPIQLGTTVVHELIATVQRLSDTSDTGGYTNADSHNPNGDGSPP